MSSKKRTFLKAMSVVLSLMLILSVCLTANAKQIVGYYTEWSIYTAHNTYCPSNIPWNKITVVNYAFSKPTTSGIVLYDAYADAQKSYPGDTWNQPLMGNFNQLNIYKAQNPGVKTMISLGGWTLSGDFSNIALTDASRTSFANSCVSFIRQYGFDGVDIDWEYPVGGGLASNTYRPEDKHNFTLFLQAIRSALNTAGTADGKHYYLSIAAPAGYGTIANTEPDQYNQYVDWINLMTYDYHGGFDPTTNHLAPLYANPNDNSPSPANTEFNCDWTVNKYLQLGVPASKLNLGLPYYSRGWSGVSGGTNGMYGNATGSPMGVWDDSTSGPTGTNPYYYVKATLETTAGYTKYTDSYTKTPWLYSPSAGIVYTYDDDAAISTKCDYINSKGLGGAMFWEFSGDYPLYGSGLTNILASKLGVGGPTSTPGPTYTPTPTGTPTPTPDPNATPTPTPTASYPAWNSTTAYNGGAIVSYNGQLWQAQWWTQNETPGIAQVWVLYGGGATSTPTPTPTAGPTSTPTPTPTTGPTATPTPTPTATPTAAPTVTPTPTPTAAPTSTPSGYPAWAANTAYSVGQYVTYGGHTYKCLQAHTSLVGWEPPNVPALWQLIS